MPFVQAALPLTSPSPSSCSPPTVFPASHSLPSPFARQRKSRSSFSLSLSSNRPPPSNLFTSPSPNPASLNRSAPLARQAARSRRASREVDQGSFPPSSESDNATSVRGLYVGSLKRRSMLLRTDDAAPRPRGRVEGAGAGPRRGERGSESEPRSWMGLVVAKSRVSISVSLSLPRSL